MKAVVYEQPRKLAVKKIEKPHIKPDQVLIKVRACGICKTDIHTFSGKFLATFPLIPGHEFAGDIVEVGSQCVGLAVGDKVVADNTVLCGYCDYCKRDQPLYCENFYSLGNNGPGGFAEYVAVNFDKVFPFSRMSYEVASLVEPTACAVHGMDIIAPSFGDDILLFGAGATGIILAQLLKHFGAGRVVVVAPTQKKLDLLRSYGIDDTIRMDRSDYAVHTRILNERYPKGFNVVIDATGHAPLLQDAFSFARKGGKIIAYGVYDEDADIRVKPYLFFANEFAFLGSFAQTHCFDRAIACLENGIVKTDGIITQRVSLDDFESGLENVVKGGDNIKTIVIP